MSYLQMLQKALKFLSVFCSNFTAFFQSFCKSYLMMKFCFGIHPAVAKYLPCELRKQLAFPDEPWARREWWITACNCQSLPAKNLKVLKLMLVHKIEENRNLYCLMYSLYIIECTRWSFSFLLCSDSLPGSYLWNT